MKIKYVGLKDFEDAFRTESGVTWGPGASHDIKDGSLATRMLSHPDVFAADEAVKEDSKPAEGNDKPKLLMQTTAGVIDLSLLDKDQLHALAKEQGLTIGGNAKAETVASKLAEAFPVKAE